MKKYIRILSLLMMFAVLASLFVGCDSSSNKDKTIMGYVADDYFEELTTDTFDISVGKKKAVTFTATIKKGETHTDKVELITNEKNVVSEMVDDGTSGDVVANDNIYTAVVDLFSKTRENKEYYALSGQHISNSVVICFYSELTKDELSNFSKVEDSISDIKDFKAAVDYIKSSKEIADYNIDTDSKTITYNTIYGISGIWEERKDGFKGTGELALSQDQGNDYDAVFSQIPLMKKTAVLKKKQIAVFRPFRNSEFQYDDFLSVGNILGNATEAKVDVFDDENANLNSMKSWGKYGIVLFDSHGSWANETPYIVTGEDFDEFRFNWDLLYYIEHAGYSADFLSGRIIVINNRICVRDTFFDKYYNNEELSNTVVFLGICHGLHNDDLANSMFRKNVVAVLGYTDTVSVDYCNNTLFESMVNSWLLSYSNLGDSAKEACRIYGQSDPENGLCRFEFRGNQNEELCHDIFVEDFSIPDKLILTTGEFEVIEPTIKPKNAKKYEINWSSSDESIVGVTHTGENCTLTPKKKGTATITAQLNSGDNSLSRTTSVRVASKGRDTVLVLDVSGSMSGAPMEEMKKAAIQFCDDLIAGEYNNRVGLVLYDSQVDSVDLTNDLDMLKGYINGLSAGSTTNMEGGLSRAIGMLNDQGAENSIKNIVIMADGLPNEGATSYSGSMPTDSSYTLFSADLTYANAVIDAAKDAASRSYNVYSLGFFHTINPGAEYNFASTLMKNITNMDDGYHEVERVEDLQFQFADVQKDISNGAKTIINIACPVDVSVSYNGETLSSNADSFNDTASFGSLQLLGKNKDVKVLSLEPGIDYDIQMNGTGQGTMDYTVNYIDDDENIEDYRSFESVPITPTTKIDSNTNNSDVVKLNVDENGDGKVDQVWSANKNSTTKQEDQKKESKKPVQKKESLPTWVIVLIIVGAVLLILILVLCIVLAKNKKKAAQARPLPQKRPNPNPQPVRPPVAPVMPSYQKQGTIVFTSGEYKGAKIMLKEGDEVIMGKDSKISSIVFSDASISRKHCSIRMVGGEFILNDYSTNGVYSSLTKTKLKLAGASYTLHYHEAITLSKTNNTFYCE